MNIFTSRDSLESKLKLLMLLRLVNKNCAQFEFKKLLILLQSSNSCLQCGFGSTSKKLWQMLVLLLLPTLTKMNNSVQRTHVNTRLQRVQTILFRSFFHLNTKKFPWSPNAIALSNKNIVAVKKYWTDVPVHDPSYATGVINAERGLYGMCK